MVPDFRRTAYYYYRGISLTNVWLVLCWYVLVGVDGWYTLFPTAEDIDCTAVTYSDTPLAIAAPGKMAERKGLVLWCFDDFVGFDGAERVRYASVTQNLFCFLLLHLGVCRASTDGGRSGRDGAAFADMSRQAERHSFDAMNPVVTGGSFAHARVFEALEIPEKGFAFLIACDQDGMTAKLMEKREANIELIRVGQIELEQALEAATPRRTSA